MKKLTKILRFRFSEEISEILNKMPNKSNFVRQAIIEKMEREGIIKKFKIPF